MMWMMLQCEKPEDFVVATNKPLGAFDLDGWIPQRKSCIH